MTMVMDSDNYPADEPIPEDWEFEAWDLDEDDAEDLTPPAWRRPVIIGVALLTAIAMAAVPLYNLVGANRQVVADNGLEVCGFDYCIVQDGVRAAGLDLAMSRFSNVLLNDEEASRLADLLVDHSNIQPVSVVVVDRLEGRVGGLYDPPTRTIYIERPVRAWTVLHEVAHAVASGHGEDFLAAVLEMTEWLDATLVG